MEKRKKEEEKNSTFLNLSQQIIMTPFFLTCQVPLLETYPFLFFVQQKQ